jgi:hypothetical protein
MNVVCSLFFLKTYEQNKLVENVIRNIARRGFDFPRLHFNTMRKICSYCGKRKNKGSFPKHSMYKDNLDSRCRKCVKKHSKIRNKLHKKAPPKPDVCECCGKIPYKWCLDHDHEDNSFRGWLCEPCNTGIGKLGDNLQAIVNAMNYFLSRSKRYE